MTLKLLTGGLAALVLPVVLLGAAAAAGLVPGGSPAPLCLPSAGREAARANGSSNLAAAGKVALDQRQRRNARIIIRVGGRMGLPKRAAVIAIATAYQESKLYNLHRGHLDSLGLFQQRPSAGWGTREQILDPRYAARQFYQHLTSVPGWRRMPLARAAQAVQRSAHPDAYAQWKTLARHVVGSLTGSCAVAGQGADGEYPPQDMLPIGLTPRTKRVKRLIETRWDEHNIGGYCPGGCTTGHVPGSDHYDGHAIDVMILPWRDPDRVAKGWRIARWLVANAQPLAIKYVIYRERIWTRDEGWHHYTHPSGGTSPTLRHMNHIHISVF